MTFLPEECLNKLSEIYNTNSLKTVDREIARIHKNYGLTSFSVDFLKQPKKVKLALDKIKVTSSKRNNLNFIMKVLKLCFNITIPEYTTIFTELSNKHNDTYLMSKAKKQLITSKEINKLHQEYSNKVKDFQDDPINLKQRQVSLFLRYLIISLYKYLPPLRGQDYFNTDIIDTSQSNMDIKEIIEIVDYNFYDIHTRKLVLKKYKTVKAYGTRIIDVPIPLANVISKWSLINNTKYLIPTTKGTRMTTNSFRDLLTRIFGVSVDVLRQSYITEVVSKMEPSEAKRIASIMGHSLSTQQLIYKKVE